MSACLTRFRVHILAAESETLLLSLQEVHDASLQQGLQCALENMDLRAELAAAAEIQTQAVELARSQATSQAAASKLHLQAK